MINFGSLLRTALVAIALVFVATSASTAEKVTPCCTAVDKLEITEPIVRMWHQNADAPCVEAYIFETENDLLCKYVRSPWIPKKIMELRKAKAKSRAAHRPSLLSVIVSTTTSSSSTSSSSSSPSSTSSSSSSPAFSSSSPSSTASSSSSPSSVSSSSPSSTASSSFSPSTTSSSSSTFSSSPSSSSTPLPSSSSPLPSSSSSTSEPDESF